MLKISYVRMNKYYVFFGNLANPLKIGIISSLKEKNMSVLKLANEIKVEQSKLSHALSSLKKCNIIQVKKQGKKRIYSLNKKTILPILKIIDEHEKEFCGKCCYKEYKNDKEYKKIKTSCAIWIDDGKSEERKYLYKLEGLGIVKQIRTEEKGFYCHRWELTDKGKKILSKNKALKNLWINKRLNKFYDKILERLETGR